MRDLQACQAEVFRRSKKRIAQRKQRRKYMAIACIGLVLCTALIAVMRMPYSPKDTVTAEVAKGENFELLTDPTICPAAGPGSWVTITGTGFSKSFTEDAQVGEISRHLLSYGTRGFEESAPPQNITGSIVKEDGDDYVEVFSDASGTGYSIVLYEQDTVEFFLSGNKLTNLTTRQSYTLSPEQAQTLYALLGITQ